MEHADHRRRPLIIIGMHRSGTSLVARCLERMGLFIGRAKDTNDESEFFQRLNTWLMSQCGGRWDFPEPVRTLIEDMDARPGIVEYLSFMLRTPRAIAYFGVGPYLAGAGARGLDRPWGWKDPRNTFTLPIWLDLFPDARVLHVYRHGVDVASSLKVRRDRSVPVALNNFRRRKALHLFVDKRGGFSQSARCRTIGGGLDLWREYMEEAARHIAAAGPRGMSLKYEDFLADPIRGLERAALFAGLPAREEDLARAVADIREGRAYAYRGRPELVNEAAAATELLRTYGYGG